MGLPRRTIIIASSVFVLLVLALSLATSLEVRAPPRKLVQISIAQAGKVDQSNHNLIKCKGRINDTGFDRADVLSGTSTVFGIEHSATYFIPIDPTPTSSMDQEDGLIGETPTPPPSPTSADEGYIGPIETSTPAPAATPSPPTSQFPILALSYTGSGGPKHCRGELIQKLSVPPPASDWKNGTCIDLPEMARCGVFFAGKDDNCEAQLFNMAGCMNTTRTYVNTVVFMPEERAVGALWRSMWVRCGVDAPEAALLDPNLLSGLLKKPGGG